MDRPIDEDQPKVHSKHNIIITPRACTRGKILGRDVVVVVIVVVSTKIAISRDRHLSDS